MTLVDSLLRLYRPGLWPPTTHVWATLFVVLVAAVVVLGAVWRGRFLFLTTGCACAGLTTIILLRAEPAPAVVTLVWLTAVAVALGRAVLSRLRLDASEHLLDTLAFSALLGYGFLALLAGILAAAGVLNRTVAWLALGCLTLLLWRSWCRAVMAVRSALVGLPTWWRNADLAWSGRAAALLTAIAVPPFLWALAPSVHWDALASHFPVSAAYSSPAGFSAASGYWYSYLSGQSHLLYALGLALVGQPLPGLIHFLFGGITTVLVFSLGRMLAGRLIGWTAAIAFACMPMVGWEAGSAYIDLFVTAYTFASMIALIRWRDSTSRPWLLISGVTAGMAVGTKLSAALMLAPAAAYVLLAILRFTHGRRPLALATTYGLPLAIIPLPWFFRNWVWTRNPVYPMFGSVFGNPELVGFGVNWSHFGRGHALVDLLRLPWDLVFHGPAYDEAGHFAFGLVPLAALLGICFVPRNHRYLLLWLLVPAVAAWFIVGQVSRYLLPVIPLATIVASWPVSRLATLKQSRLVSAVVGIAAVTGSLYCAVCLGYRTLWNYNLPEGYPYRYVLGLESRDQFLTRALRVYPALKYINEHSSPSSRVFSPTAQIRSYIDVPLDDPVYTFRCRQLALLPGGPSLAEQLHKQGYDYILVDRPSIKGDVRMPYTDRAFLTQYTRLEFAHADVYVYKVGSSGAPNSSSAQQLLANAGFDDVQENGTLSAWVSFGNPKLISGSSGAHSTPAFVRVTQSDGWYQRAVAKPNSLYGVALWSRADAPGQSAWLQVLWLDATMNILDTGITAVSVDSNWREYDASFTSPPATAFVQVYARAAPGGTVDVDDVRLTDDVP